MQLHHPPSLRPLFGKQHSNRDLGSGLVLVLLYTSSLRASDGRKKRSSYTLISALQPPSTSGNHIPRNVEFLSSSGAMYGYIVWCSLSPKGQLRSLSAYGQVLRSVGYFQSVHGDGILRQCHYCSCNVLLIKQLHPVQLLDECD